MAGNRGRTSLKAREAPSSAEAISPGITQKVLRGPCASRGSDRLGRLMERVVERYVADLSNVFTSAAERMSRTTPGSCIPHRPQPPMSASNSVFDTRPTPSG
ncbi:hypothetical protein GCM10010269_37530 [Streptomyces humidus]|uniref:Uncharacterized protein n=1 Tax=Streptomyces humidus TaxID=52259 RepID=A0A918FXW9_9ACTN|nr:hypothetical protein GCM10010269_37530 [Streptomyces humidus]